MIRRRVKVEDSQSWHIGGQCSRHCWCHVSPSHTVQPRSNEAGNTVPRGRSPIPCKSECSCVRGSVCAAHTPSWDSQWLECHQPGRSSHRPCRCGDRSMGRESDAHGSQGQDNGGRRSEEGHGRSSPTAFACSRRLCRHLLASMPYGQCLRAVNNSSDQTTHADGRIQHSPASWARRTRRLPRATCKYGTRSARTRTLLPLRWR